MKIAIIICRLLLAFSCSSVLAQATTAINTQPPLFCPLPEQLIKDGDYWVVIDTWKSDMTSSGKKIVSFLGAEWEGINIGKIICLYKEEEKYAFPVALVSVHPVLILEPTTPMWTKTKDGYRHCISTNLTDCPFFMKKTPIDTDDIYQQIKYQPKPLAKSPFTV